MLPTLQIDALLLHICIIYTSLLGTTNLVNLTRNPETREINIELFFSIINSRINNL